MIPKLKLVTTTSVISYDSNEEIRVQAVLTDLPDNIYPAANVSINLIKINWSWWIYHRYNEGI